MFLVWLRLRLNRCIFESNSSEICAVLPLQARDDQISLLRLHECHLSLASRGCSKSIALLFPKVTPFLFKFLDILGNLWGRRESGFSWVSCLNRSLFSSLIKQPKFTQNSESGRSEILWWRWCDYQLERGHLWD